MPITILNRWTRGPIAAVEDTDNLREAVIRLVQRGVSLANADLRSANLSSADLSWANLRSADLSSADLSSVRADFFDVLSFAPREVPALITALDAGRVNGSTYSDGECGCLIGTLAIASGQDPKFGNCTAVHELRGDGHRPIEQFFLAIRKGDKPEKSQHAKIARDWAQAWLDRMAAASANPA